LEGKKRREDAWRDVERRLSGNSERLKELRELAAPLVHYIPIREGRAYWQLALSGAMRTFLLRRAAPLVERGELAAAEDVLYLACEEMELAIAGELSRLAPLVEERRREWGYWAQRRPPAFIGGAEASTDHASTENGTRPDQAITGLAASRGTVTARARVLADISHADRLRPGEVLVCAMSSPPWTPLFALAAAVVTDSGGILSHPAIVAREYGIPCVVGTSVGTQRIRDGELITVDGDLGEVRIEGNGY
jgi:pyruvate,water dikinase